MTALVGLDVGTTGVKALALSPEGEVLAVASRGYKLSTPHAGWAEQDPEAWVAAAESALREVGNGRDVAGIGFSGQMHGLVVLDAERPADPPGDPLERPAHGGGVPRDRGARRARAADRAHGEPGADRVHRAQAPLAPPSRAGRLRPHRARAPPEGLRPPAPDGRVGDRRLGRLRDAPPRRRAPRVERGGAGRARAAGGLAPARARVARPRRRRPRRRRSGARRSQPARATSRPPRSASASTGPGRSRSCSGPPASSSPRSRVRARPGGPRPCLLPRRAGHLAGDGRDAVRRRLARVVPHDARRRRAGRPAGRRGGGVGARRRGTPLPPLPGRRAHAARRPGRARRVRRAPAEARPRGACPCRPRGRRVRPARLARPDPRAGRRDARGPGVGWRRAQPAVAPDRCLGARPAARADRVGGRLRVRRCVAREASRRASSRTSRPPSGAASASST